MEGQRDTPGEASRQGRKAFSVADFFSVLRRRKWVAVLVFLATLGVSFVVMGNVPLRYESRATLIPVVSPEITQNWLRSRHVAELVIQEIGDPLRAELGSGRTVLQNSAQGSEFDKAAASVLVEHVDVRYRAGLIEVVATFRNPAMAQAVASAYVLTLQELRPYMENITRDEAFDRYYKTFAAGGNAEIALADAKSFAANRSFWILLDDADLPSSPSGGSSNATVVLAIAGSLVFAWFSAFLAEGLSRLKLGATK